jgi:CRP-like cAMP-binding protein
MASVLRSTNRLLQSLPASELEALNPYLELVELVREAVLVEAGAPLTHVYLPQSGILSMTVRLAEGQAVEAALVGRDSIFGGSAGFGNEIALTDVVVLLPGRAFMLTAADVRAAADRSAALRSLLARHEQGIVVQAQQSAACNASHSVEARLSRWLLRVRDLTDSESLPLTQECLAQIIGVQRNAVSIVANALQKAGIISYSRGQIEITDVASLRATACECYQAVKAQHDRLLKASDGQSGDSR